MTPVPLPLRIAATWLGILPVVLVVQAVLAPVTQGWPAPWPTVLTLALAVPVAVVWSVPLALRLAARVTRGRGRPRTGGPAPAGQHPGDDGAAA